MSGLYLVRDLSLLLILSATHLAFAQKPGDEVIATGKVQLRLPDRIVESVEMDTLLTVEQVNGEWLWVTSPTGRSGWVMAAEVTTHVPNVAEVPRVPATVRDLLERDNNGTRPEFEGAGSAFVVHPSGYLITNVHVVRSRNQNYQVEEAIVEVVLGEETYIAEVLQLDERRDLALLKIEATGLESLPLGDSNFVELGQELRVLGFPLSSTLGESLKVTSGIISGIEEHGEDKHFQTDAITNPGNSGGPVLNLKGEVIGIHQAGLRQEVGKPIGFSIPVNYAKQLLAIAAVDVPASNVQENVDGVTLVKRSASAVAFVRVKPFVVTVDAHQKDICAIAMSEHGIVATASDDEDVIKLWYRSSADLLAQYTVKGLTGGAFEFSPDGRSLMYSIYDDQYRVQVIDISTGQVIADYEHGNNPIRSGKFLPDGKTIATTCASNTDVRLWTVPGVTLLATLQRPRISNAESEFDSNSYLTLSKDGTLLAALGKVNDGHNDRVYVWDVRTKKLLQSWAPGGYNHGLTFLPESGQLAINQDFGTQTFWDPRTGKLADTYHNGSIAGASYDSMTHSGVTATFCGSSGSRSGIFAWDVQRRQPLFSVNHFPDSVDNYLVDLAYSPDGTTIATCHPKGKLVIWDVGQLADLGASQNQALADLQQLGGKLESNRGWGFGFGIENVALTDELFDAAKRLNCFSDLRHIAFRNCRLTSGALASLGRLHSLRSMELEECTFDDDALSALGSLYLLESISFEKSQVRDQDLKYLEALTQLKSLNLIRTDISDDTLAKLKSFSNLSDLYLDHTGVTDDGLQHLDGASGISCLLLRNTNVTDRGMSIISQFDLYNLALCGTAVTDDGLAEIGQIKTLGWLDLSDTQVTAQGLKHIESLPSLYGLSLVNTRITDDGLASVGQLNSLKDLDVMIGNGGVTLARLARELSGHPNIHTLRLRGSEIDNSQFQHLADFKRLRQLDCRDMPLSDEGLEYLYRIKCLETLILNNTNISDEGLAGIADLPLLNCLWLYGTNVTNACVQHLAKVSQLRRLDVRGTKIDEAGIRDLKSVLPQCTILDE